MLITFRKGTGHLLLKEQLKQGAFHWADFSASVISRIKYRVENKTQKVTTELRWPPVGRLPSCMGTLSRELWDCAADTEVTCAVGTATHVLYAGLDVRFRVNPLGAGAPGLWTQHLVTGGLLKWKNRQVIETMLQSYLQMQMYRLYY